MDVNEPLPEFLVHLPVGVIRVAGIRVFLESVCGTSFSGWLHS